MSIILLSPYFSFQLSSHLNCMYIAPVFSVIGLLWRFSSLYGDNACMLYEIVNNLYWSCRINLRPTATDFGPVLFTLREWGEFYLPQAFVEKNELLNYSNQQKAICHTCLVTPSDRTPGCRSRGFSEPNPVLQIHGLHIYTLTLLFSQPQTPFYFVY